MHGEVVSAGGGENVGREDRVETGGREGKVEVRLVEGKGEGKKGKRGGQLLVSLLTDIYAALRQ